MISHVDKSEFYSINTILVEIWVDSSFFLKLQTMLLWVVCVYIFTCIFQYIIISISLLQRPRKISTLTARSPPNTQMLVLKYNFPLRRTRTPNTRSERESTIWFQNIFCVIPEHRVCARKQDKWGHIGQVWENVNIKRNNDGNGL